jgi:hypothetical protein
MATRRTPVQVTELNLSALDEELAAGGGMIGKVAPTSAPHLRRCLDAGLLGPAEGCKKGIWMLTPEGVTRLKAYRERKSAARLRWATPPDGAPALPIASNPRPSEVDHVSVSIHERALQGAGQPPAQGETTPDAEPA